MTISRNLIGRKKAHGHPCSVLFSFYQLKIGSIVAPSESMKFPIVEYRFRDQKIEIRIVKRQSRESIHYRFGVLRFVFV